MWILTLTCSLNNGYMLEFQNQRTINKLKATYYLIVIFLPFLYYPLIISTGSVWNTSIITVLIKQIQRLNEKRLRLSSNRKPHFLFTLSKLSS